MAKIMRLTTIFSFVTTAISLLWHGYIPDLCHNLWHNRLSFGNEVARWIALQPHNEESG